MSDAASRAAAAATLPIREDDAEARPLIDHDVGVIGAGFAGVIAGLTLLDAGRSSFAIFERASTLGGVWRDNVYPGCACDIRSHLYSIASRPDPNWKTSYARQADILAYLQRVAADSGLRRHIRFDAEIVEARFLAADNRWRLTMAHGGVVHVRSLILATGPLNRLRLPDLAGLESFAGGVVHSSAWDPALTLEAKRVGVIGTGASAVQIVPNIAAAVASLTVFQRSAAWVMPRLDRPITGLERWVYRHMPGALALVRQVLFWMLEGVGQAFFGQAWVHRLLRAAALRKLDREVHDPVVRATLTPDYALGCKRMVVSDDYLRAFNRRNVELVTDPITEVIPSGVRTAGGRKVALDVLVLATGFFVADPDGFLPVVGSDGRVLAEQWAREGAQAYRGVTIAGYPNLAMLLGPNSGLSYSSVLHVVESQMAYVLGWLDARDRAGAGAALDVRAEVQADHNSEVQARLKDAVWMSGCRSWYLDRNGRNSVIAPVPAHRYRRVMARFDRDAYTVLAPGR